MGITKKSVFFCLCFALFLFFKTTNAQTNTSQPIQTQQKSEFWEKVRFGGGLGLSIGNNFTDIMVAPSAIYQFNEYIAAGVGLQGSYIRVKDNYDDYANGGTLIFLAKPIE